LFEITPLKVQNDYKCLNSGCMALCSPWLRLCSKVADEFEFKIPRFNAFFRN